MEKKAKIIVIAACVAIAIGWIVMIHFMNQYIPTP